MAKRDWVTTTRDLQALRTSSDSDVWKRFHTHFFPVILNFARKMGLPEADAEDAAQETMVAFLRAYQRGGYDRGKGRLTQWLFGVAKKVILNRRRRLPPERQIPDKSSGTSFWNLVEDTAQVTWDAEWRQMVLKKCLEKIRTECGDRIFRAFEMYALSSMPVDQVSRRLNMTKNAIYIAKTRVLSRLRELEREFESSLA